VWSEEEKNKVLARRFLEAFANGDLDTLDELLAPISSIIVCFPAKILAGKAIFRWPPRSAPPSQTSATSSSIKRPTATRW
jgi:hypothetical protein